MMTIRKFFSRSHMPRLVREAHEMELLARLRELERRYRYASKGEREKAYAALKAHRTEMMRREVGRAA